jgi:hypothetical protein
MTSLKASMTACELLCPRSGWSAPWRGEDLEKSAASSGDPPTLALELAIFWQVSCSPRFPIPTLKT